jgi:hypothetical protein
MKIALKIISLVTSLYGLILTTKGLMTFTYFTTLSNVFIDIVLLCSLVMDLRGIEKTNRFYTVKFMATVSITLTFLIYMFILAPATPGGVLAGYFSFGGGSFGVHFAGPLTAILDFLLYDHKMKSTWKNALFAMVPPLCYVLFVVLLGQLFGVRWGGMMGPYNFLNYGAPCGWFGFVPDSFGWTTLGIGVFYMIVILSVFFFLVGLGYLRLKDLRAARIAKKQ